MDSHDDALATRLLALGATRTVYSFYYPEVKALVEREWMAKPHYLYERPYLKTVASLHLEFAAQWLDWVRPAVEIDRSKFPHFDPCAGSSEAIRDSIAHIGRRGGRLHVFRGEYEGYRAYANAFEVPVLDHDREDYRSSLKDVRDGDWFFLSQPSSLDGNVWAGYQDFVGYVEQKCPTLSLAVDLCYVGTTAKLPCIDVSSPRIRTLFFSLSKVYGVYFHRIGGVFAKEPSASLVGNEYFRNNFSLLLGRSLLESFSLAELPSRYKERQLAIVAGMQKEFDGLKPADVTVLASMPKVASPTPIQKYIERQGFIRVCLTPGFDQLVGR